MSTLAAVLEGLSPEQQRLLSLRMMRANKQKGIEQPEQGVITGPVPFIQDWFFEQNFPDQHHWNVSALLEVREPLDPVLLKEVVRHLLMHHDALRLRFVEEESGWRSFIVAPDDDAVPFQHHDLSLVPDYEQSAAIEVAAAQYQRTLNLSDGPIMRVVLFDLGPAKPSRLLIVMHHLVSDVISLQIFMEDLHVAYRQLTEGKAIAFPAKTTSFKELIERGVVYASKRDPKEDSQFYLNLPWEKTAPIPLDFANDPGQNIEASANIVRVALSESETTALMMEIPRFYSTKTVTLTALVQAFKKWTGVPALNVDLAGHGRETVVGGADLSRTVAWIAGGTRVLLNIEKANGASEALALVDEQIMREESHRMVEGRLGFDSLLYHCGDPDIMQKMRNLPESQLYFNVQGQAAQGKTAQPQPELSMIRPAKELKGATRSPQCVRHLLFEVTANIFGEQLVFEWRYSEKMHRRSTIETLAENYINSLRALINYCQSL